MIHAGALGFDISHHQDVTESEMRAAKQNGYEFVIIRASHGMNEVDRKFAQHYAAAKAAGLQVGVYAFYYYADKDKSAQETVNFLRTIRNKHIDLPVFIDFENRGEYAKGNHLGMLSKSAITDRALAAITEIKKAGYTAGIYADVDWLVNKMEMSRIPGDVVVWCADWHGELSYFGPCHLRQYTSTGTVAGIGSGSVDMDRWLVDYPLVAAAPSGAVGKIVNCVFWCNRRSGPSDKVKKVGIAKAGMDCFFNGKRVIAGVTWYHDSLGNWIHSKFVSIDDSKVPYM